MRIVLIVYAMYSVSALILYYIDKRAAELGRRRVPEKNLLIVGLVGGWPGALIAQLLFRHKTSKPSFQLRFWLTVMINCSIVGWFCLGSGFEWLKATFHVD